MTSIAGRKNVFVYIEDVCGEGEKQLNELQ